MIKNNTTRHKKIPHRNILPTIPPLRINKWLNGSHSSNFHRLLNIPSTPRHIIPTHHSYINLTKDMDVDAYEEGVEDC